MPKPKRPITKKGKPVERRRHHPADIYEVKSPDKIQSVISGKSIPIKPYKKRLFSLTPKRAIRRAKKIMAGLTPEQEEHLFFGRGVSNQKNTPVVEAIFMDRRKEVHKYGKKGRKTLREIEEQKRVKAKMDKYRKSLQE